MKQYKPILTFVKDFFSFSREKTSQTPETAKTKISRLHILCWGCASFLFSVWLLQTIGGITTEVNGWILLRGTIFLVIFPEIYSTVRKLIIGKWFEIETK